MTDEEKAADAERRLKGDIVARLLEIVGKSVPRLPLETDEEYEARVIAFLRRHTADIIVGG